MTNRKDARKRQDQNKRLQDVIRRLQDGNRRLRDELHALRSRLTPTVDQGKPAGTSLKDRGALKASVHFYTRYYEVGTDGLHCYWNNQHLKAFAKSDSEVSSSRGQAGRSKNGLLAMGP